MQKEANFFESQKLEDGESSHTNEEKKRDNMKMDNGISQGQTKNVEESNNDLEDLALDDDLMDEDDLLGDELEDEHEDTK